MEPLRLRAAELRGALPGLADPRLCGVARLWLGAAVAALAASGLLALLVVAARTSLPGGATLGEVFPRALVVHVTFGVLAWLAAFGGALWTLGAVARGHRLAMAAYAIFCTGLGLVAWSGVAGSGDAQLADYVPVLEDGAFFAGLLGLAAGTGLAAARAVLWPGRSGCTRAAAAGALAVVATLGAAASAWLALAPAGDAGAYTRAFWAPGHILQVGWVFLMLSAWLLLARAAAIVVSPRAMAAGLGLGLGALGAAAVGAALQPPGAAAAMRVHTTLMAVGGLAALPVAVALVRPLARPPAGAGRMAVEGLRVSVAMYLAGGAFALAIAGADTRVPAHYHASIAAVSVAFMAAVYLLAPRLGGSDVPERAARWQLRFYGLGQFLHALGLAWSGGWGAPRKSPLAPGSETLPGTGVMAFGGVLATLAGAAFVVLAARALVRGSSAGQPADEPEGPERHGQDDAEEGQLPVREALAAVHLDPFQEAVGSHVQDDAHRREGQDFEQLAVHTGRSTAVRLLRSRVHEGTADDVDLGQSVGGARSGSSPTGHRRRMRCERPGD